ncbi:hypothetical protein [Priestia endophytica]|uniref:hypothetical protein n=1 Tax=Priestia endophytica TaxID=135735 RepID=UPI00227F72E1|nr:hypothetical protein [Priestia endophytica]MCY8233389.1 hypothetical protein [Priestia endophytica]
MKLETICRRNEVPTIYVPVYLHLPYLALAYGTLKIVAFRNPFSLYPVQFSALIREMTTL